MIDAAGNPITCGDLAVGDNGKVYIMLDVQYNPNHTEFIRVAWVRTVRGELKWDPSDVHGQHANMVVKITKEEATWRPDELRSLYAARRHSKRDELLERKREVGQRIRLYEAKEAE